MHQSVFELIHTEDQQEFRRNLHWALNPPVSAGPPIDPAGLFPQTSPRSVSRASKHSDSAPDASTPSFCFYWENVSRRRLGVQQLPLPRELQPRAAAPGKLLLPGKSLRLPLPLSAGQLVRLPGKTLQDFLFLCGLLCLFVLLTVWRSEVTADSCNPP